MALKIKKEDRQFVKNLAVKHKLVPHLEAAIKREEFSWTFDYKPKEHDDAWHPSGDCTPTLFELYNKVVNPIEDDRSGMYKTFMVGHFWHQYLQEVIKREGWATETDIERRGVKAWGEWIVREKSRVSWCPVKGYEGHPQFGIMSPAPFCWATGSADVAPCEIPGHPPAMVDFKTMKSMDFRRDDPPAWAVDKWECQGNIYMDWFDLDYAIFIGINKDSPHDMKEFEFHRNQPLIDAIYQKWELVSLCLDEGVAPPEDEDIHLPLQGVVPQ